MRAPDNITIPELSNTWDAPTLDIKKPKDPKQLQGLLQAVSTMLETPPAAPPPPMQTDNIAQRAMAMNQYQQFQQPQYPGFRYGGNVRAGQPIRVNEDGGMEGWRQRGQSDIVPIAVPPNAVVVPQTDGAVIPNVAPHQVAPQPIAIPTVTAPNRSGGWNDDPMSRIQPIPNVPYTGADPMSQIKPIPNADPNNPAQIQLLAQNRADDPLKDTGWASYTPAMAAQRDYNENRPPTVDEAWKNYDTVSAKKEHPNKFLSGLFLALQGLNKFANPNDKTPVVTLGDAQRNKKMAEAKAVLDSTIGKEKFNTEEAYNKARTQNIYDDNERLQGIADVNKADKATKATNKALDSIYKGKVFDKTNPAHRKQAQAAGLDPDAMPSWDFNNPVTATINGIKFERDRLTGEYSPTGLPESEKDKIVSLDISVPGEKNADGSQKIRKFNVPQSQAATIADGLQRAGMQIEAAAARQDKSIAAKTAATEQSQDFKVRVEEYRKAKGDLATVRRATETFTKIYMQKHKGQQPPQEEINKYLATLGFE